MRQRSRRAGNLFDPHPLDDLTRQDLRPLEDDAALSADERELRELYEVQPSQAGAEHVFDVCRGRDREVPISHADARRSRRS